MSKLWVDNAIVVLVVLYTFGGVLRGYKQELYSLIFWLIGLLVAWCFSQNFSIFFLKLITSPTVRLAASFTALMGLTLLLGRIISLLLGEAVKKNHLRLTDRIGGAVLGPIHGLLAVFMLVLIAGLTPLPKDSWWRQSAFIPPFQTVIALIKSNSSSKLARSLNYAYS